MIRFGELADGDVQAMLEAAGRDHQTARAAAALACGSAGRALSMTAEALADREDVIAAYEELHAGESEDLGKLVTDLVERRKNDRPALGELLDWQMRKVEVALGQGTPETSKRLAPLLDRAAGQDSAALLEEALRTLWAIRALERNGNPKLVIRELLLDVRPA
jgi:hypothetical protein